MLKFVMLLFFNDIYHITIDFFPCENIPILNGYFLLHNSASIMDDVRYFKQIII